MFLAIVTCVLLDTTVDVILGLMLFLFWLLRCRHAPQNDWKLTCGVTLGGIIIRQTQMKEKLAKLAEKKQKRLTRDMRGKKKEPQKAACWKKTFCACFPQ